MSRSNQTLKTVERIVKAVRDRGEVSFGELCILLNISPSTLYNYRRVLRSMYPDIYVENDKFYTVLPLEVNKNKEVEIKQVNGQ